MGTQSKYHTVVAIEKMVQVFSQKWIGKNFDIFSKLRHISPYVVLLVDDINNINSSLRNKQKEEWIPSSKSDQKAFTNEIDQMIKITSIIELLSFN